MALALPIAGLVTGITSLVTSSTLFGLKNITDDRVKRESFARDFVEKYREKNPDHRVVVVCVGWSAKGQYIRADATLTYALGSELHYDVVVFPNGCGGTFSLLGDGGFINWAYGGSGISRNDHVLTFDGYWGDGRDTLNENNAIGNESSISSLDGRLTFKMQSDGNVVLYRTGGEARWDSKTYGKGQGPYELIMQEDGNLVAYDKDKVAIWASNTYNQGSAPRHLVLQNDGNCVLYDASGAALWSTGTFRI
mmetsp:Transcript_8275/g.13466  ORF Transcript_8275/g.13466 Transcript_8275/m.13466 type:complete len:251 (-) Transcript_8275:287-1039(-)|eukprot:CAMPEP_0184647144 /NCGR_PEP_ID=MMETSP0308-20130426/4057_1 /TAXON_ID=38269 /ORGANISM="Gloeochaete witrockiana, Strain SAG 46.84" /LENGTH=250 /DNA_ID=CAMNT_0027077911 /DNA_START=192 /DNA_END=944 /DNA_ORIENTATION=+